MSTTDHRDEGLVVHDLTGVLEERLAALEAQLGELAEGLESLARDGARTTTERLGDVLNAVREASERMAALPPSAGAVGGSPEELVTSVRDALHALAGAVDKGLESLSGRLSAAVLDAQQRDREHLDRTATDLRTAVEVEVSKLGESPAAARAAIEGEISALRVDLADALDEIRERLTERVERTTGDVTDRLGAVETGLAEAQGVLTGLRSEWTDRTGEVVAEARLVAEAVLDEARSEMTAAITEVRRALQDATGGLRSAASSLDDGTTRLADTGRGLLAYLAERDRLLEAERDRVLHELLDEFAEGLSAKERRAFSERFGDALQRRRDARDAARWRAHEEEGTSQAAAEELPPPVELYRPQAPAKQAPAKRAVPAKKPAKKAAPAKETVAAKKAVPAKKATPGRATATTKQPAARPSRRRPAVLGVPDVPNPIIALDAATGPAPGEEPES